MFCVRNFLSYAELNSGLCFFLWGGGGQDEKSTFSSTI